MKDKLKIRMPALCPAGMILIVILSTLLGACNFPAGRTPAGGEETLLPPTQDLSLLSTLTQQAVEKGEDLPTSVPTTTDAPTQPTSPTWTPEEGEPLPSSAEEIKFRPGGTLAYLRGEIAAGQGISYTFGAGGGQTLIVNVSSNNQDVYFEVKGLEDDSYLASFRDEIRSLTTVLPSTQTYRLTLTSNTDNVYFLTLEIPANLDLTAGSGPVFIDGYVDVLSAFHPDAFTRVRYLMDLEAGTVLNVDLTSAAIEDLTLALTGKDDGVPYLRHVVKTVAIQDFPVTVSQGYYLDVYAISGQSDEYQLEIEVTP